MSQFCQLSPHWEMVVNLEVVDRRLALGGVQEEDVKIKLPRPPPKRVLEYSIKGPVLNL